MMDALSLPEQEIHAASRRWSGIAVLLVALLALSPMWGTLRAALRVDPLDTIPALGSFALMIGVAYIAFHSEHFPRRWYRAIDLIETITGQAAFLYLIHASRDAVSFFWTLYFTHVFFISISPNARTINMAIIGMGSTALALAFIIWRGDAGSAMFCLWAGGSGMLTFWLLNGLTQRLATTISNLKKTEGKLAETMLELERQRIARDLHDGVGAELAALLWQMRQLDLELAAALPHKRVSGLVEHARRSLVELRSTVWAIRAPRRPWPEVVDRLRRYLAHICTNRVRLELSATRAGGELPGEACLHLERFVQEAAQNALQHARASRLRVELTFGPTLHASVEDDGVGLLPGVAASSEGGLRNLRERLGSIGGELTIEACAPGTRLSASFPLLRFVESKAAKFEPGAPIFMGSRERRSAGLP